MSFIVGLLLGLYVSCHPDFCTVCALNLVMIGFRGPEWSCAVVEQVEEMEGDGADGGGAKWDDIWGAESEGQYILFFEYKVLRYTSLLVLLYSKRG